MKTIEIYLKPEYYNARLRATVPGAWIAVTSHGSEIAICREHEAESEDEARAIFNGQQTA